MPEIKVTVRQIRKRLGERQSEFAERFGVNQSTVSKWESGAQRPDFDSMFKLSELSGLSIGELIDEEDHQFRTSDWGMKVVVGGAVQAGEWVEAVEWDEYQKIEVQIPTPKDWPEWGVQGFVVKGDSMNNIYPEGSIVFAAPVIANKLNPGPGDRVIVERRDDRELYEVTLKELNFDRSGKLVLWPRSSEPEHQAPIDLKEPGPGILEVRITGIVVAAFVVEPASRHIK